MRIRETPRLVVIGASTGIAKAAHALPCDVVFVQQPGSPVEQLVGRGSTAQLYSVDFTGATFPAFVESVLRPLGVDGVVSVTEEGLIPAAQAAGLLGLRSTPVEVVTRLRDKVAMRATLQERAPDLSVRFVALRDGRQAAEAVLAWPDVDRVIVKPRKGTASRAICCLRPADLASHGDLGDCLMEEYLPGPEYSAESFSVDGSHRVLAITEKHVNEHFIEVAHVVPPTGLRADDLQLVHRDIGLFLDAVGLVDGPAHTEFKFCGDGIKIIESHNRIGGDGIPRLVEQVTGVDLKAWALGWPIGLGGPVGDEPGSGRAAAIAFATAEPGLVTDVRVPEPGTDDAYAWATVRPGDMVGARTDSSARVGGASTVASDADHALRAARTMASRIVVTTRQDTATG